MACIGNFLCRGHVAHMRLRLQALDKLPMSYQRVRKLKQDVKQDNRSHREDYNLHANQTTFENEIG